MRNKLSLLKHIKYWTTLDKLIKIANAHIQGVLIYGLALWSNTKPKHIEKIENLRVKTVRTLIGYDKTNDLNRSQILKLFNWKSINELNTITQNVKIHKVINTKLPLSHYKQLTEGRNEEQIKYYHIITKLRSQEDYNNLPMSVRTKSVRNFKLSYKRYRKDLTIKPKIIYNKYSKIKYTLVWPGG